MERPQQFSNNDKNSSLKFYNTVQEIMKRGKELGRTISTKHNENKIAIVTEITVLNKGTMLMRLLIVNYRKSKGYKNSDDYRNRNELK